MFLQDVRAAASRVILGLSALLSLFLYAVLVALGDLGEHVIPFLVVYLGLFLIYVASLALWWRVRGAKAFAWGLGAALVFRLVMLASPPSLSDDIHRYMWDGRVIRHGGNPLLHTPDDPSLVALRDPRWDRVAHREVPSVYPPLAQAAFALAGSGSHRLKFAWILLDLGVVVALALLLARAGQPQGRAMVYGWCPLAVVEVAGSGHLEPLALLPALLAILTLTASHRVAAGGWTALASAGRLLHAAFALAWWRRLGPKGWLTVGLAGIILWAPFLGEEMTEGLRTYGRHWEFNAAIFPLLLSSVSALDLGSYLKAGITGIRNLLGDPPGLHALYFYTDPQAVSRFLLGTGFVGWAIWLGWRRTPPVRAAYLATGAFLLLSPTLHPWYVLQVVPFLAFFPSLAWLTFTGTVSLSYLALLPDLGRLPGWVLVAEYLPLFGLFALGPALRRWKC